MIRPAAKTCAWCKTAPVKDQRSRFCSLQCFGKARAKSNRTAPTPLPIKGARWITLARSGFVLVDETDYEWLSGFSWIKGGSRGQYAVTSIAAGRNVYMHQLLLPDVVEVDHRDGNGLNNRRSNLREARRRSNSANRRAGSIKTQYKGVAQQPNGAWCARIRMPDGRRPSLGSFATVEEAAQVYDVAARLVHGEFACLNFPQKGERGAR